MNTIFQRAASAGRQMKSYMNQEKIDYGLLHYRIRSSRSKQRAKHKDYEKKLLALNRELGQLYREKRNLGWVALHPPVMRGWKRFFILRDDVARGRNATFFSNILSRINTVQYSSRKDFKVKKRKTGRKIYVIKEQRLQQLCETQFNKFNFTDAEKQLFEEQYVKESWQKQPVKKFVFREPWRFVLRTRPNMITRIRARDETIEKRIHEISSFLERRGLNGKLNRLLSGSAKWYRRAMRKKDKNPFMNKSKEQFLDQHNY